MSHVAPRPPAPRREFGDLPRAGRSAPRTVVQLPTTSRDRVGIAVIMIGASAVVAAAFWLLLMLAGWLYTSAVTL